METATGLWGRSSNIRSSGMPRRSLLLVPIDRSASHGSTGDGDGHFFETEPADDDRARGSRGIGLQAQQIRIRSV